MNALAWLRKQCRASPTRAARVFSMQEASALVYRDLDETDVDALCAELDLSLFLPRFDSASLPHALVAAQRARRRCEHRELELQNLVNLHGLREVCVHGSVQALWIYRITQQTADAYRAMDEAGMLALSRWLDASAFVPRYEASELTRILGKPPGHRAVFAAAYEADIAAAASSARPSVQFLHSSCDH